MQIVIDIPEQDYYNVLQYVTLTSNTDFENLMIRAVQNGTPLPKGHGRLIDVDEVIKIANKTKDIHGAIWNASTIIAAEREEKE